MTFEDRVELEVTDFAFKLKAEIERKLEAVGEEPAQRRIKEEWKLHYVETLIAQAEALLDDWDGRKWGLLTFQNMDIAMGVSLLHDGLVSIASDRLT